jgi:hypothetical protein
MNFNTTLIPCSALPAIMTTAKDGKPLTEKQQAEFDKLCLTLNKSIPQQEKYDKFKTRIEKAGKVDNISGTGIYQLKDIYVREKWGKRIVSASKDYVPAILNGSLSESASLGLVCELDGITYKKHKELIKNRYLKGIIDCYTGSSIKKAGKVMEIKTAASMQSLMGLVRDEEAKSKYHWQIMGYLAITGAEEGEVCHCLVNYHERVINDEINKFLFRTKGMGFDGDYIDNEVNKIKFNLTFDEIPPEQRVVRFKVSRDEDAIKEINEKVRFCRKWLNNFDELHRNMNK